MTFKTPVQRIGERITFAWRADALDIFIDQKIPRYQQTALEAWMVAWLAIGVIFLWSLLHSSGEEQMFFSVSIAFWSFFAFRIGKVILWRRKGVETIRIQAKEMSLKNSFGTIGKAKSFGLESLQKMEVIRRKPDSFISTLDQSFWIMGGDTIQFSHQKQTFVLGKQLNEKDAHALAKLIDKGIRKYG
jgi:hypothetical protein